MTEFELKLDCCLISREASEKIKDMFGYRKNQINNRRSARLSRRTKEIDENHCISDMVLSHFFDCLFSKRTAARKDLAGRG
jgi:hypothetical protein